MSIKKFVFTILTAVASIWLFVSATPSGAEANDPGSLITDQKANWGLKTAGASNVVGSYDSLGWALEELDNKVYVGGKFLEVTNGAETVSAPYLARFDTFTSVYDSTFSPDFGGPVLALEPSPDGGLFVGGELKTLNGSTIGGFAKIDPATGNMWPGWNTRVYGGSSYVSEIKLEADGWLYVVGNFTTVSQNGNILATNDVIRINPTTGAVDTTWLPNLADMTAVRGVAKSKTTNDVYLAGLGVTNDDAALAVDATTAAVTWDSFEMNYCCSKKNMWDVLATEHGTVFFAGEQHGLYVYDETSNMDLIQNHISTGIDLARDGGDFQDITRVGDSVYVTCHCWGYHYSSDVLTGYTNAGWGADKYSGTNSAIVAYDVTTGLRDMDFDPYMSGDIGGWDSLAASDGCLWITGGISYVGQPGLGESGRDLVRLCDASGGGVDTVAAPVSCEVFIDETAEVTWDNVAGIEDYVIYRSVDGGNDFWRGVVSDGSGSFTDSVRSGELTYSVASRLGGVKSPLTECSTETPVVSFVAPVACDAVIDGDVLVSWDAGVGVEKVRIFRTVDGSPQYWRGAVVGVTSFTDSSRSGVLAYFIEAEAADGTRSARIPCDMDVALLNIVAVSSCSVTVDPVNANEVTISWPAVTEPGTDYIVRRSVDGSNAHWRGVSAGTTFEDTLRAGQIQYFVEARYSNGERADLTACS